jgi:integrase
VLRRAFKFGYRDYPEKYNPTYSLKSARIRKRDRTRIDPFTIQDAETLIAAIHRDWGEAQGNYDEFRFFTGLRPSEQIALLVADFDTARGTLSVTKARVAGIDKDSTKTGEDRRMDLCARALDVLNRQLALRKRLELAGKINHGHLFFKENGGPICSLQYPYRRWRWTLARNSNIRYRKPYVRTRPGRKARSKRISRRSSTRWFSVRERLGKPLPGITPHRLSDGSCRSQAPPSNTLATIIWQWICQ